MSVVTQAAAGSVSPVSVVPGESIDRTLTHTWRAHVAAHLERCGAVRGPLADWVCREGRPLWSAGSA